MKKTILLSAAAGIVAFSVIFAACENQWMKEILQPKTIIFNSNGGSPVSSQTVIKYEKIRRPKDPVRGGYSFCGWFVDNDTFQNLWDFDVEPESDMILHAAWYGTPDPNAGDNTARIGSTYYATLNEAIVDAPDGTEANPTEITLLKDVTAPETGMIVTASSCYTIPVNKHIKLTVEAGQKTITAAVGGFSLFTVNEANSSLTLGPTTGGGTLILNGNDEAAWSGRQGVYVNDNRITMNNGVTIKGFKNNGGGGGVYVTGAGSNFTMNGGEISGNTATAGGGVYIAGSGSFTMSGGTIGGTSVNGNTATTNGGGVYLNIGTFTMSGTAQIIGNNASSSGNGGGGVYVNSGTFTMSGAAKITGNTAYSGGGMMIVTNGTFNMNGGEISGNTATAGGGVYVNGGTFNMGGGKISGNTAGGSGGGVYVNSGTFNMGGGYIYGSDGASYSPSGAPNTANVGNSASVFVSGGTAQYDGGYFTYGYGPNISTTDYTLPKL